ncbi:MAG: glycoside hydrolase family 127 protein, partial [Verrucomicrobia bacterium]|nr:glycoside hydrolase family 127 protein [Verrucomicrobiota bacterium]
PVLITRGRPAAQWAKPLDAKKLQFRTSGVGRPRDVELKPFFAFRDRRYTVYFDIVSPAEWRQRLQAAEAEREKARRLAERGIDQVKIGDAESEKAHQLQGEKTGAGRAMGRPWRHAVDGGWFAYRLGVDPEKPVDLMCLYWGSESGERLFDILVEGKRVATQRLRNNRPGKFFEQIYPIPQELTRGKQNVLVRFQARPGAMAGGVFGVWTLRRGAQPEKQEKAAGLSIPEKVSPVSDYRLKPAAIKNVKLLPGFWRNRLETNRVATVWHCFEQCEKTGRIDNFRVAAGIKEGQFRGYYFNDSDVYKVMEGAAYTLMTHPDPKLEAYLDELIAIIARAQRPDGYIYTPRIIGKAASQPPGGMKRWASIASAHELYCMGHLIEAAVAHAQATGKETFLNVARKAADLICSVFNEKGNLHPSGHEEIELALVKLYRQTGDPKYLREAYFFLELRGRPETHRLYGPYSQDHQPVAEQREAVGHAVRAAYLYSGTADAAALLNHRPYFEALRAIWKDVVGSKLYITGGIGATGGNEGFDASYRLPNLTAYCETCAAIANALWNHRMFLLTENGEHMDVFERSLYNNVLSGVALDGRSFFYSNPLESDGRHRRSPWFGCACCPPNIARILPQVPSFAYSAGTDRLWVNLYLASEATIQVGGGSVQVAQRTRYPWSGRVELTLRPEGGAREFALCLRIPGWARNQALPGGLYWFARERRGGVRLRLNGKPARWTLSKGYAVLRRRWRAGDRIELILPMPIRRVLADPRVQDDAGKVAFQRGPIVYCVEWPEVPGGSVKSLMVPDGAQLAAAYEPDLLGGVETLRGQAVRLAKTATPGQLERKPVDFKAIPYYAWANRGRGEMAVWLART